MPELFLPLLLVHGDAALVLRVVAELLPELRSNAMALAPVIGAQKLLHLHAYKHAAVFHENLLLDTMENRVNFYATHFEHDFEHGTAHTRLAILRYVW